MNIFEFFLKLGENYGAAGIFIGSFLESIGVPFVGTSLTLTSGSLIASGKVTFIGVVTAGTLGNVCGSTISYGIGYYLGKFIRKVRKGSVFKNDDKINLFIKKYGPVSVLLGQLYGTTRTYISIPAGMMKMPFKKFILYTLYGGVLFSAIVCLFSLFLKGAYDKFLYPFLGISFGSAALIFFFLFIITHFSLKYASVVSQAISKFFNQEIE